MKRINTKIWIVYGILFVYLFSLILFPSIFKEGIYTKFLQQILWFAFALYCYYASNKERFRARDKVGKIQIVIIFAISYLIIYFLLGLLFGYKLSPYSHQIFAVILNIWVFVPVIFFQEYIRAVLVRFTKRRELLLVVIFLLFSLIELNYTSIGASFATREAAFKYISSTLLPVLAKNALFTYFALICDYVPAIIFRTLIMLSNILLPIFPDLDWFVSGLLEMITYLLIFISVNYLHNQTKRTFQRGKRNQEQSSNPKTTIPILIVLLMFVSFVAGFFPYQPIAIVSDSMIPKFQRGDAVVIKKVSLNEAKKLKTKQIIQYYSDGRSVIHRIIDKTKDKDGNIVYITKGDNNQDPDMKVVQLKQIRGVVQFSIPKVGYPSVLIYEFLKK